MKIRLYQTNNSEKMFLSFRESLPVNFGDYDCVYAGDVDCDGLEPIYRMFNINHTEGYIGRSMSVSDIVEILEGENQGFYFCDSIGFKFLGNTKEAIHEAV